MSFDRDTASLMGIDVTRLNSICVHHFRGAGRAGRCVLGINYTLYPTLGSLVVKGFIASVIGGLGSLPGAVIGAMLLGIMETTLISTVGSGYAPVFTFLIMLGIPAAAPARYCGSNIQEKGIRGADDGTLYTYSDADPDFGSQRCGVFVLTGMTGMFSLGQAAFMAIGAYTSGLLVTKLGVSIFLAWPAGVVLAVIIGFIVGLPTGACAATIYRWLRWVSARRLRRCSTAQQLLPAAHRALRVSPR